MIGTGYVLMRQDEQPDAMSDVIFDTEPEAWMIAQQCFWDAPESRNGVRGWLKVCKVNVYAANTIVLEQGE